MGVLLRSKQQIPKSSEKFSEVTPKLLCKFDLDRESSER